MRAPICALLCLIASLGCFTEREEAGDDDARPPNLILIVVDTLRADHLSHYGYERPTAAPLDGFRDRATRFAHAFAAGSWTGPSTISIHTGLSPLRHGALDHGDVLPPDATPLAEVLRGAGYATYGLSFNYEVSAQTGYDRGFDRFGGFGEDVLDYPDITLMRRRVARWGDDPPAEPFFLYLHPMNVHGPYRVPNSRKADLLGRPPSDAFEYYGDAMKRILKRGELEARAEVTPEIVQSLVDQYDTAIHYSMTEIAGILDDLEARGLLENTAIILTADHGEELFEHGGFSHGYSLYREVLHVPLYLALPGQTRARSSEAIVSVLDIYPTLLDLARVPIPEHVDGRSLVDVDAMANEDRTLVQATGWKNRAVGESAITSEGHLIELSSAYDAPQGRRALFDWRSDPGEESDLLESAPAHRRRTEDAATARRAALATRPSFESANVLDEMDAARLRALGYAE